MATVESIIPSILFTHMATLVLSPPLPIAYSDAAFTPPATAYLQVDFIPNTNVDQFLSDDGTVQHRGLLQVTVVHPVNIGVIKPNEIAGLIVQHFAKGTKLYRDGVKVRIYAKPSVAPPLQEPDRLRVPVVISYQAFH